MATDSADLRQMWWSMAEVCAVGGQEKRRFCVMVHKASVATPHCVFTSWEKQMYCNLTLIVTIGTGAGGSVRTTSTDSVPTPTSRALIEIDWKRGRSKTCTTRSNQIDLSKHSQTKTEDYRTCWVVEGCATSWASTSNRPISFGQMPLSLKAARSKSCPGSICKAKILN